MLTYIKHHILKITEEDRWNDLMEKTFFLMFYGALSAWILVSYLNFNPKQGPKYPPSCQSKHIGNRALVNHKICCSMLLSKWDDDDDDNNRECMTYEEFWDVFDSCKPKGGGFVWDGFIGIGTTRTPPPGIQLF